jgi:hypothetical protein
MITIMLYRILIMRIMAFCPTKVKTKIMVGSIILLEFALRIMGPTTS